MDVQTFLNKPSFEKGNIFEAFSYAYLQRYRSDIYWHRILDETPSTKMKGDYGVDIWGIQEIDKVNIYYFVQCKVRPINKRVLWEECTNLLGYGLNFSYFEQVSLDQIKFIFMGTSNSITNKFISVPFREFIGWDTIGEQLQRYLTNLTPNIYNMIKVPQYYYELIRPMPNKAYIDKKLIKNIAKFEESVKILRPNAVFYKNLNKYDNAAGVKTITELNEVIGVSSGSLLHLNSVMSCINNEDIGGRDARRIITIPKYKTYEESLKEKIEHGSILIKDLQEYFTERGIIIKRDKQKMIDAFLHNTD